MFGKAPSTPNKQLLDDAHPTAPSSSCSRDIWDDVPVLLYLTSKCYDPTANESEKSRIRKRARRHVFKHGRLFRYGHNCRLREVPVLSERLHLARTEHRQLGHKGEKIVLKELRQRYFWERMASDVKTVAQQCPLCQSLNGISGCLSEFPPWNTEPLWLYPLKQNMNEGKNADVHDALMNQLDALDRQWNA